VSDRRVIRSNAALAPLKAFVIRQNIFSTPECSGGATANRLRVHALLVRRNEDCCAALLKILAACVRKSVVTSTLL
jgi:hypothetical protein